jgi:hypothetical protein
MCVPPRASEQALPPVLLSTAHSLHSRAVPADDGEAEDCECAAVLTTHTQDVKTVCWHPVEDVRLARARVCVCVCVCVCGWVGGWVCGWVCG